jgi:hypothetical protein
MTEETPRKTLTITRKPASNGTATTGSDTGAIKRTGKRIIRREDLPADKLTRPGKFEPKPKKPAKTARKPRQPPRPPKTPPSELRARELSDSLNNFPVWRERLPLAIGIEKQVFKHIADLHLSASKRVVNKLLHCHTHNRAYLLNVGRGGSRFNLDGTDEGAVLPPEREHAGRVLAAMPQ